MANAQGGIEHLAAVAVAVLVVAVILLVERAAHARTQGRVRVARVHDARLRALGADDVDAAFDRLVATLRGADPRP